VGAVRSIRTVFAAMAGLGAHAETLPSASAARNCTRVSPSAATVSDAPDDAADQVAPPLVEVR